MLFGELSFGLLIPLFHGPIIFNVGWNMDSREKDRAWVHVLCELVSLGANNTVIGQPSIKGSPGITGS